jgi:uncharacterized protein (DUF1778 family)
MGTSSNFALRIPSSLKIAIEKAAREDGTTSNQFIISAAAEKLSALKTAEYFSERAARADLDAFDRIMNRETSGPVVAGDEMPE